MKIVYFTIALLVLTSAQDYDSWKTCKQQLMDQPEIFTVSGKATQYLAPKIGLIRFNLETLRETAGEALAEYNSQLQMAVEALKQKDTILSTSQLNIQPRYNYYYDKKSKQNQQVFEGYQVTNQLTVRTTNLEIMGELIDTGINSGINKINSISFELDPEERKKEQRNLIDLAIQDATKKAELAVKQLGYMIVGHQSLQFYAQPQIYQVRQNYKAEMDMTMEAGNEAPSQVFAGDQAVSMEVQIGFIIKQKEI